ncbi:MAG: GNAT family N-acetyltransferase [Anaerolineae bacterium]|nr:GNAT family N-acetyltransferase [Anaerolineae bacterium]
MRMERFDPHTATEADWVAFSQFENIVQQETWPDDPPRSVEYIRRVWQAPPQHVELHIWVVWDDAGDAVIGRGNTRIFHVEHNRHVALCSLAVHPAYRRQGIGKQLLARVAEAAQQAGRIELMGWTDSQAPDGMGFAERIGATPGIPTSTNQLDLAELDRDLMRAWMARAQERASDYRLEMWEGTWPDADIEAMVHVLDAMNDAPRDEGWEDETYTVEQLRAFDAARRAQGTDSWTTIVRHKPTGAIAGYSDLFWNPNNPAVANQGDTGVLPAHRNRGLGRWLKAAMVLRLLAERPGVRFIRTGNADSNQPMLSINYAMGFRQYKAWTTWRLAVDDALAVGTRDERRLTEESLAAAS